jgi:hypothetical protein
MTTHPAEVNEALGLAFAQCQRLVQDAEKRGDQSGADAWLVALRSIEAAEAAMREARTKQNWARKEEQPTIKPPFNVSCTKCHAGIGQECKFTEEELAGQVVVGGGGVHMVHRERGNKLGADLKPRSCTCRNPDFAGHVVGCEKRR